MHGVSKIYDTLYHLIRPFYILPVNKLNLSNKLNQPVVSMLMMVLLLVSQAFAQAVGFVTIEWTDLIPQDEFDILSNPPAYMDDIEDGSAEDQIGNLLKNTLANAEESRYQQALVSTNIKPEMDGRAVRIPGFIVPIEFDGDQIITEFFLVPYFGACLHMPPPAPNQIIHVKYAEGLKLEALYNPFWISGILKASLISNDMATAAYGVEMRSYEAYTQ